MILQYKGFKNNWCYEEAETITHANVYVGVVTRDYRVGGARHKLYEEQLQSCETEEAREELRLGFLTEMHKAVNRYIKQETHCCDEIAYHIDEPFENMENVSVVTLADRHRTVTRVFKNGAYLLNNRGQTVHCIAIH